MGFQLACKTVVVTGGASGIGYSIAKAFAEEKSKVVVADINEDALLQVGKELSKTTSVFTKRVDVSSYKEMQELANESTEVFQKIDIWINNAGIFSSSPILDETPENWDRVLKTNLYSCFYGIQMAGRAMKKTGGGVIINTSSYSSIVPAAKRSAYVASKYGINGLTRLAAGELAPYNIRVNAVAPGTIETPMQKTLGRTEEEQKKIVEKIALHRTCEPDELAQAYLFLASDSASYITASVLEVSGGKISLQDNNGPWTWE